MSKLGGKSYHSQVTFFLCSFIFSAILYLGCANRYSALENEFLTLACNDAQFFLNVIRKKNIFLLPCYTQYS